VKENGRFLVNTGDFQISIPASKLGKVRKSIEIGEEVIFGIRPENIYHELSKDSPPEYEINVVVDVIEPMGSELIVSLATGKHILQAIIGPDTKAEIDQKIKVVIDMNKSHLFHRETEEAIY
jgi:multiple sugar transport system ATP-binding protein